MNTNTSPGPTEERILPVELTEIEIKKAGQELAKHIEKIEELEAEKSEMAKEYNEAIKELQRAASSEAHKVNTGTMEKPVECTWQYYWNENRKVLYRTDTGLEVTELAIQDHERQEHLDIDAPVPDIGPGGRK